jgi:hypothetical protein
MSRTANNQAHDPHMRINENGQMLDDMMLSLAMYWTGRSKPLWLKIWRIPELRGCQKAVANYPKRRKYIPYSHVNKFLYSG